MTLTSWLYVADVIEGLNVFATIFVVLGVCLMIIALCAKFICADEYTNDVYFKLWSEILDLWPYVLALSIFCCLIPNKSTVYMMLGTSYLQDSTIPKKVSQALEIKLDDYIEELTTNKQNGADDD